MINTPYFLYLQEYVNTDHLGTGIYDLIYNCLPFKPRTNNKLIMGFENIDISPMEHLLTHLIEKYSSKIITRLESVAWVEPLSRGGTALDSLPNFKSIEPIKRKDSLPWCRGR